MRRQSTSSAPVPRLEPKPPIATARNHLPTARQRPSRLPGPHRMRAQGATIAGNRRAHRKADRREGAPATQPPVSHRSVPGSELWFRNILARTARPHQRQRTTRRKAQCRLSVHSRAFSQVPSVVLRARKHGSAAVHPRNVHIQLLSGRPSPTMDGKLMRYIFAAVIAVFVVAVDFESSNIKSVWTELPFVVAEAQSEPAAPSNSQAGTETASVESSQSEEAAN